MDQGLSKTFLSMLALEALVACASEVQQKFLANEI